MSRSLEELQKRYSYSKIAKPPHGGGMGGGMGPGRGRRQGPGTIDGKMSLKKNWGTIKRVFSYLGKYKIHLVLIVIFMLLTTATSLAGSYLLRPVLNNIADGSLPAEERIASMIQTLIVLGAVYAVSIFSTYMQSRLMLTVTTNSIKTLREELFVKMQALPLRYFDSNTTGDIMSRYTSDVDNIETMVNNTITSLISGVVTIVGTIAIMFYANVWLTLITLAFVPLFLFGGGAIAKASGKYYRGQQDALGAVNGYIEETVSGAKVIKVFNHEEECGEEFTALNNDLRDKQFKAQFYGSIMGPVMGNSSQISYAVTAGVGVLLCIFSGFDIGGVQFFCNTSRHFSMPINQISQQMTTIFAALAGADRVFAVMDMEPEKITGQEKPLTAPIKGDVVLEDVSFGYYPDRTILKHISLYAHPGQKIAFVGSTGAGKTTVTNLLNRFYDINEGKITIDGIDISSIPRDQLRENIAMVLQDTHLFTGTVRENIRYGRLDATDEEVEEAAKIASAHSFIMRLKDGYDTLIEGDGANLSQGQRQLLNIARAAISKAPILVLDEATSSVDTRTERHIEHGMARLMSNRTTFVIAHRLSTVRNADAIMVLEKGEIIERGNHDALLEMKGRYYELYTGVKELD